MDGHGIVEHVDAIRVAGVGVFFSRSNTRVSSKLAGTCTYLETKRHLCVSS